MPPATLPPLDHPQSYVPTTNVSASTAGARRKTPSELRQEQLNRAVRARSCQSGATGALPSHGSGPDQKKGGTRLVDTRVVDIFAAIKPTFPSPKQKDELNRALSRGCIEVSSSFRRPIVEMPGSLATENADLSKLEEKNVEVEKEGQASENRQTQFRDVTQITSRPRPQTADFVGNLAATLKVMSTIPGKGLANSMTDPANVVPPVDSVASTIDTDLKKSKTAFTDLSLKLSARFVSVNSLHWCHRTTSRNEVDGVKLFVEKYKWSDTEELGRSEGLLDENGMLDRFGSRLCQSLYSWVHPPPQYLELYDAALACARGDGKTSPVVASLYRMWEDSFRSLYYNFSHKRCNLFYFCTQQFVVMFFRGTGDQEDENSSKAYWTRSTRGLRKRLQEQAVEFSMPFCTSDADLSILEDLNELTEFEKLNPGQTRLVDPRTAIDNSSQSLLQFEASNVHYLFDFLLNYRFLVGSVNPADFPVLYSPVEFSQASLYMPEVKSKSVQHSIESSSRESGAQNGSTDRNSSRILYTLELKGHPGAYITPWVIKDVCAVLQKSQKLGYEVSFVTGPLSDSLNVAQGTSSTVPQCTNLERL